MAHCWPNDRTVSGLTTAWVLLGVVIATLLVLVLFSQTCSTGPCRLPPIPVPPQSEVVSHVFYCPEKPATPLFARVQVLIDSSGSMNGFQKSVPSVQAWMRQGVSMLRGSQIELKEYRACFFDGSRGIGACAQDFGKPQSAFKAQGATNLDQAILSAENYDLSLIATDGVASTGARTGDCAGGVDAACVGRSLISVLKSYQDVQKGPAGGLWVIPLVSRFEGSFPTERALSPKEFQVSQVVEKVREEVAQVVAITDLKQGPGGQLLYQYAGSKAWFLLILARQVQLGRAAAHALSQQMSMSGVQPVQDLSDFKQGLGAFRPIEIFPGTLPAPKWKGANLLHDPSTRKRNFCGNVGYEWDAQESVLKLRCRDRNAEILLGFPVETNQSPAQCVELSLLAPFHLELGPAEASTGGMLAASASSWTSKQVSVHLKCGASSQTGTGGGRLEKYVWKAQPDLAKAADCLASSAASDCPSETLSLLNQLSTENPAYQPHRTFGLVPTLRFFLKEAGALAVDPKITMIAFSRGE